MTTESQEAEMTWLSCPVDCSSGRLHELRDELTSLSRKPLVVGSVKTSAGVGLSQPSIHGEIFSDCSKHNHITL